MDKKYFTGKFQFVPMAIAIMLAAPCAGVILESLGVKPTQLPQIIAGSISGALVGVGLWLFMVWGRSGTIGAKILRAAERTSHGRLGN